MNAVLGNVRHAGAEARRRVPGQRLTVQRDRPGRRVQARQDLHQFALAVPGDPGHAEYLAPAQLEAHPAQRGQATRALRTQVPHAQQRARLRTRAARALAGEVHAAAHHQLREALTGRAPRRHAAHDLAAAQHRHAVRDGQHLVQLVRDEDQAAPVRLQFAHHAEQALGLLRGQHAGGLVEDQDPRAAQQGPHDLHALLLAGRQVRHARLRVHLQPVPRREFPYLPRHAPRREQPAHAAQRQILRHGVPRHQQRMLRHQPDPQPPRLRRTPDPHRLACQFHRALVGLVQAVQDRDQGAFARAVLAQQGQHLTRVDGQVHRVVRDHTRETFRDATQPQRGRPGRRLGLVHSPSFHRGGPQRRQSLHGTFNQRADSLPKPAPPRTHHPTQVPRRSGPSPGHGAGEAAASPFPPATPTRGGQPLNLHTSTQPSRQADQYRAAPPGNDTTSAMPC